MERNKDIGSVLKRYRKENQYTQKNVARELNISRQAISAWENNQSYPDIENLYLSVSFHTIIINISYIIVYSEKEIMYRLDCVKKICESASKN